LVQIVKKSLKIPKGLAESLNRRRTDNTMATSKRTNNDLHKITYKTRHWATRMLTKNRGRTQEG